MNKFSRIFPFLAVFGLLASACGAPPDEGVGVAELADGPADAAPVPPPGKVLPTWQRNCIGSAPPVLAGECDDRNACTTDTLECDGVSCSYSIVGAGAPCSGDNLMACWGGECCPIGPVDCHDEGVQSDCADGSICFEGRCWISCDGVHGPTTACQGTEFPTCGWRTVGSLRVRVCK